MQALTILLKSRFSVFLLEETNKSKTTVSSLTSVSGNVNIADLSIGLKHFVQIILTMELTQSPQFSPSIICKALNSN